MAAVMFVGVVAVNATEVNAANCTGFTMTLKYGMRNSQVMCLQQMLNEKGFHVDGVSAGSAGMETTYFGNATKAAVKMFQASAGLTADGVFGPMSRASLVAHGSVSGNFPAGCTSASGYSSTTGMSCASVMANTFLPPGCTSAAGFSPVTGGACYAASSTASQTGPVTVMLATDNPAAGTIVAGQATADLLHVTFTGTGTVNSVMLKRTGISDQSTLTNVYLYDGVTRLTDGYSFNNNGDLTMSSLNLMVSGSRTISVRADVLNVGNTAYSLGVNMTSFTVTGGAATNVNLVGNTMYVATGSNAASVSFTTNTLPVNPTVNPGTTAYTVWSAPINVVGTHSLWLKAANFRVIGSAPTDALANVKLYKDGLALGSTGTMTTVNGSNYVTFDLSAMPVELTTGNHTLDVRADVVKGSARTIQLSVQLASDMMVYDSQVGINVVFGGVTNATYSSITINAGSMTAVIDPTFQAMTKVTGGATNVAIAKFKLHAYGEDMKVNTLSFTPTISGTVSSGSTTTLQNVTAYFNGSQIGTQTATGTSGTQIDMTPGSQMIVPAGVDSYLEIRADIRNSTSINYTAGTLHASLVGSSTGAEGMNSHNGLAIPSVTGNTLNIQTGTLNVGKNASYGNQVMNANTANVKLGSYTMQNQSTSESVRVTSLRVTTTFATPTLVAAGSDFTAGAGHAINVSSSASFNAGDVITVDCPTVDLVGTVTAVASSTQLTTTVSTAGTGGCALGAAITVAGKTATAITYVNGLRTSETSGSGSNPIAPTGTDTFSVDFTLAPGATKTIDLMADLGGANYGTILTKLAPQGIGSSSNVSIFANGNTSLTDVTGQTITMATGTVATPTLVTSSSTTSQYVAAGATGVSNATTGSFKFVSSNGNANITEITFSTSGATDPITAITVGGQTGNVNTTGNTFDITGLNLAVPNGSSGATFPVMISYGSVGAAGIGAYTSDNGTSQLTMTKVYYTIGGASSDTGTITVSTPTMRVVGSKPVVAVVAAGGVLAVGNENAMNVTVSADQAGDITLQSLDIHVSTTDATLADGADSTSGTGVSSSTTSIFVKDASGAVLETTAGSFSSGNSTITFNNGGYLIAHGTTITFKIFVPVSAVPNSGGAHSSSISSSVGAAATFVWTDTAGGATGNETTNNTLYLNNYPTNSVGLTS